MEMKDKIYNNTSIIKTITKYHNSTENLLDRSDKNESSLENFNISSKLFYNKNKTSIFGNFYRKEQYKKKNSSLKSPPEINQEFDYLINYTKKTKRKTLLYIPTSINDINIEENNKNKPLNPIFLNEIFSEFDKRTKKGKIENKIKLIHRIIISLIFLFLLFEIIVYYKSRKLTDKIIEEENLLIEIKIEKVKNRKCSKLENTLRIFNLINVILCEIILIKRELYIQLIGDSYFPLNGRIFDFIFIGIFFPPFINPIYISEVGNMIYMINLSNIFFSLSFFKFIFFFKYSSYYSKWNNSIAKNIAKTLSSKTGHLFVLKCRLKEHSFGYLIILILTSIFFFSIILRTAEYLTYNKNLSLKSNKEFYFDSYLDTFWAVIMISYGIAYGDIYPKTFFGRGISILITIVGYILISKFFVTLMSYLTLTQSEKKIFLKMKRLNSNENLILKSIKVIRDLLNIRKFLIIREKESENKIQRIEAVKHISILLLFLNNDIKNFMDFDKIDESYTIQVDDILKDVINKIEENLKCFEISFNKLEPLNIKLSELLNIQNKINNNLHESNIKQRYILNYLINLNNTISMEIFKHQFFIKKYCSNQNNVTKLENLDYKKRQLSDKLKLNFSGNQIKVHMNEQEDAYITGRGGEFKLNYSGIKTIRENYYEDSSVSNSHNLQIPKNKKNNCQLNKELNGK